MVKMATLLSSVINTAHRAGQEIMDVYDDGLVDTAYKADLSPITRADTRANDLIVQSLNKLTPNVPIISEESLNEVTMNQMTNKKEVWMVDPLDGTKDFLKHNDEFTVNIAFIRDGKPILGVVYAPALKLLYYAAVDHGAYKQIESQPPIALNTSSWSCLPIIAISRSHSNQTTKDWLKAFGPHTLMQVGSSLKLCYVADGTADIYPRLSPIMEWDIAAGDAILRLAGGSIREQSSSSEPVYNKVDFHQPPFIAFGVAD
jgi:3'(2'), 5'-bisphosphate nucleotidase